MKKTWLVLPGYCVGLGGLLLITYRTLLAISSPGKTIMVSVNRFGEQYLDLVALAFLWVVCLVGLLCLSYFVKEMNRREDSTTGKSPRGVVIQQTYSLGVSDFFLQQPALTAIRASDQGFSNTDRTVLSLDAGSGSVSMSVLVPLEEFQG